MKPIRVSFLGEVSDNIQGVRICVSVRGGMWIGAFMPIVFGGEWCAKPEASYQTTRALRIARSLVVIAANAKANRDLERYAERLGTVQV